MHYCDHNKKYREKNIKTYWVKKKKKGKGRERVQVHIHTQYNNNNGTSMAH